MVLNGKRQCWFSQDPLFYKQNEGVGVTPNPRRHKVSTLKRCLRSREDRTKWKTPLLVLPSQSVCCVYRRHKVEKTRLSNYYLWRKGKIPCFIKIKCIFKEDITHRHFAIINNFSLTVTMGNHIGFSYILFFLVYRGCEIFDGFTLELHLKQRNIRRKKKIDRSDHNVS